MTPEIYKNIKSLSYGELLHAIQNIKDNLNNAKGEVDIEHSDYYNALVRELDARQKEV